MEDENILARVGTFFLVIGSGVIVMFIASDLAETVNYDLFFIGVFLGGVGFFLRRNRSDIIIAYTIGQINSKKRNHSCPVVADL